MLTTLSIMKHYTDSEFESFFSALEKEQLMLATVKGKQDGSVNKPKSLRQHRIEVISPLKSVIEKALTYNYSRHQPVSNIAVTKELRASSSEKTLLLEKEKNAKEKKLLIDKSEQAGLKAGLTHRLSSTMKILIPALFGISEAVLVYTILQGASTPVLIKFSLTFAIGLTAAFGLNVAANWIQKSQAKAEKIKRYIIVIASAFLVALALGFWRAGISSDAANINSQIINQGSDSHVNYSAWPFVIVSFVAFCVALSMELKLWISDAQKKLLQQYEDKAKAVKKTEQEYAALKREIDDTKAKMTFESGVALQRHEYAAANEYRLVTLAQQIINHYEATNMEFRTDYQCPAFFGEEVNFGFKFFFTPLFNDLKEKK